MTLNNSQGNSNMHHHTMHIFHHTYLAHFPSDHEYMSIPSSKLPNTSCAFVHADDKSSAMTITVFTPFLLEQEEHSMFERFLLSAER